MLSSIVDLSAGKRPMAKPSKKSRRRKAALPPPAPEPAPRVAPRRATAERRLRILERLTTGLTVAHIARVEGLSVRRIRRIITEMLASRGIDPAAGFVQLQIARLSEALIVARTMMMEGDLQAMDRLIRLTGELDRYHGFAPSQIPAFAEAAPSRRIAGPRRELPAPSATPVEAKGKRNSEAAQEPRRFGRRDRGARLTSKRFRPEMVPQRLEKIESAPGNGMGSDASNLQHLVHGRVADRGSLELGGNISWLQTLEKPQNAIGITQRLRQRRGRGFAEQVLFQEFPRLRR
jgi:hypothetical protein